MNHAAVRRNSLKFLYFVLIMGGALFAVYKTGLWDFFASKERILKFIESCGIWDEAVFILLQASQVVFPPIPGAILNVAGGYLYGTVWGVIWSTIGTTSGAWIAFLLSRRFGKPLIDKFFNAYIIRRIEYTVRQEGTFLVFLLFLIPGFPKDYLCYVLGVGPLSVLQFLAVSTIGRLFGTILETLGGDYIRHEQYDKALVLAGMGLSMILIVAALRNRVKKAAGAACRATSKENKPDEELRRS